MSTTSTLYWGYSDLILIKCSPQQPGIQLQLLLKGILLIVCSILIYHSGLIHPNYPITISARKFPPSGCCPGRFHGRSRPVVARRQRFQRLRWSPAEDASIIQIHRKISIRKHGVSRNCCWSWHSALDGSNKLKSPVPRGWISAMSSHWPHSHTPPARCPLG